MAVDLCQLVPVPRLTRLGRFQSELGVQGRGESDETTFHVERLFSGRNGDWSGSSNVRTGDAQLCATEWDRPGHKWTGCGRRCRDLARVEYKPRLQRCQQHVRLLRRAKSPARTV